MTIFRCQFSRPSILKNAFSLYQCYKTISTSRKHKFRDRPEVFSGNSCIEFTKKIVSHLKVPLGRSVTKKFSNKETQVDIYESVRGKDVFVVQTGCGEVNDNLMELLIMIHALKIASAAFITVIIPCFPYARQDKKIKSRAPITAKLVANMLTVAGANHILTMDLHAAQIQGFFDIAVDNLTSANLFIDWIKKNFPDLSKCILVAPDASATKRITYIADQLKIEFAIMHKERTLPNQVAFMILVGNVAGKIAIMIDDIVDTASTLKVGVEALVKGGVVKVYVLAVHGILSGPGIDNINNSDIEKIYVTNTVPQEENVKRCSKLEVLDVTELFAESVKNIHTKESLSHLF